MVSDDKKLTELVGKYQGQITLTGVTLFLLTMTSILTYTIMILAKFFLVLVLIVMLVLDLRYDDQIKHTPHQRTEEERRRSKKAMKIQLAGALVVFTIAFFLPGIPIFGYALSAGSMLILLLRARLSYLLSK